MIDVFENDTPLDRYLAQQTDLTAVGRFVRLERHDLIPTQQRYYRDLIPLTKPQPGQQYAFAVDLDSCTGCKSCVTACRSLNGLDDDEAWRTVGLLHHSATAAPAVAQQHVTTGCHHCVDPACLNGCPVDAYEKDPITGIVAHLDDQCIGCGYCTLTCPYEVPRYNAKRGIVRKCDMCAGRLAEGEAPACVQACPSEAISITIVDQATVVAGAVRSRLLPGAPHSHITSPTTQYRTTRPGVRAMQPADLLALRPAEAHPPLAVMLVLTQLSVGAFIVDFALQRFVPATVERALQPWNAGVALLLGLVALAASVLHLGRPRYAFRVVIGFRHSWLSREAVAFGAFAGTAALYATALWWSVLGLRHWSVALGAAVGVTGLTAVYCSAKIYVSTKRVWWAWRFTGPKFVLTALMCGLSTVLVTSLAVSVFVGGTLRSATASSIGQPLCLMVVGATTVKLLSEAVFLRRGLSHHGASMGAIITTGTTDMSAQDLHRTARLLTGALQRVTLWRFGAGLVGGVALPLWAWLLQTGPSPQVTLAVAVGLISLVTLSAGELVERYQFFRAVSVPRMPGPPA